MEDQPGVGPFSWIAAGSAQEVVGTTESGSVWVREFGDENPAGTRWNLLSSGKRFLLRNASVFFGHGWARVGFSRGRLEESSQEALNSQAKF